MILSGGSSQDSSSKKFPIFAMFQRWKKTALEIVLICSSKDRSGFRVLQRPITDLFEMTVQPSRLIVRATADLFVSWDIELASLFCPILKVDRLPPSTSLCLKHRLLARAILGLHQVSLKCTAVCHPHSSES